MKVRLRSVRREALRLTASVLDALASGDYAAATSKAADLRATCELAASLHQSKVGTGNGGGS